MHLRRSQTDGRRLPDETLNLLAYARILNYGYTNDAGQIPDLVRLYGLVADRFSWRDRVDLLAQVSFVLDSHEGQLGGSWFHF